jgi:hypothetical protein
LYPNGGAKKNPRPTAAGSGVASERDYQSLPSVSPPERVDAARYVVMEIELLTNRIDPSASAKLAPLVWLLWNE